MGRLTSPRCPNPFARPGAATPLHATCNKHAATARAPLRLGRARQVPAFVSDTSRCRCPKPQRRRSLWLVKMVGYTKAGVISDNESRNTPVIEDSLILYWKVFMSFSLAYIAARTGPAVRTPLMDWVTADCLTMACKAKPQAADEYRCTKLRYRRSLPARS